MSHRRIIKPSDEGRRGEEVPQILQPAHGKTPARMVLYGPLGEELKTLGGSATNRQEILKLLGRAREIAESGELVVDEKTRPRPNPEALWAVRRMIRLMADDANDMRRAVDPDMEEVLTPTRRLARFFTTAAGRISDSGSGRKFVEGVFGLAEDIFRKEGIEGMIISRYDRRENRLKAVRHYGRVDGILPAFEGMEVMRGGGDDATPVGMLGRSVVHNSRVLLRDLKDIPRTVKTVRGGVEEGSFEDILVGGGMKSFAYLPIAVGGEAEYVMMILSESKPIPREIYDIADTMATGAEIGAKIIETEARMRWLLDGGYRVQKDMFPPKAPKMSGFSAGIVHEPAEYMNGDIFGVADLGEGRYGVYVGDAPGHGPAASGPASYIQGMLDILHSTRGSHVRPAEILSEVNDQIVAGNRLGFEGMVTAVYGVLDAGEKRFTYSNAGHLPPLVYRAERGDFDPLNDATSIVLGLAKRQDYDSTSVDMKQGDMILLFTDGLVETLGNKSIDRGMDVLRSIVKDGKAMGADELAKTAYGRAKALNPKDDVTLLVLKAE
jgi:phosphoserine phosphatase RsbU/P